jgi:general secretion pathway protein H
MFRQQGFTLLEVLLVVAIAGIALGAISLSVRRADDATADLRNEAETIARQLRILRTEAVLRDRQTAFETNAARYVFLVHEDSGWKPIDTDAMLRETKFDRVPTRMTMEPLPAKTNPLRIVFGREPVDAPFLLTMQNEKGRVFIRADGAGRFVVEQQ